MAGGTPKRGARLPTSVALLARLPVFQPTQRATSRVDDARTNAWGSVCVSGRLGQRHADVLEAILFHAQATHEGADGTLHVLVDPARVRRTLSDAGHDSKRIRAWIEELINARVNVSAPRLALEGTLLSGLRETDKATRRNPLTGGERRLWVVTLGPLLVKLIAADPIKRYHDPRHVACLIHGVSQAAARHVLTHRQEPPGGWTLDGLIGIVAGDLTGHVLRDRRRDLRADAEGLARLGIQVTGDRVRLVAHRPGSVAQNTDPVVQSPGVVVHRPGG